MIAPIEHKKVEVRLADNGKGYLIQGDSRIPEGTVFPRVTSIIDVLDKGKGLEIWRWNLGYEYIKNTLPYLLTFAPDLQYDAILQMVEKSKDAAEEVRKESSDFGSQAHYLLEELTYNPNIPYEDKFKPVVDAWYGWLRDSGFDSRIVATEQSLYYYKDGIQFAGTADLIVRDTDNRLVVIDYKTSKDFHAEMVLQVGGAYTLALAYSGNKTFLTNEDLTQPMRAIIVKLPKTEDKQIQIKEIKNIPEHQNIFKNICEVRLWKSNRKNKWNANMLRTMNRL